MVSYNILIGASLTEYWKATCLVNDA